MRRDSHPPEMYIYRFAAFTSYYRAAAFDFLTLKQAIFVVIFSAVLQLFIAALPQFIYTTKT